MKLENHLPPDIYRFYDHLFLEDREFLDDVKNIYDNFKLKDNYNNPIYWWLIDKYDYDLFSIEDKNKYDEYHMIIRQFLIKYCIPYSFKRDILEYIMTWKTQLCTHAIINFWYEEIVIKIPFNFSLKKWNETWKVIKEIKDKRLKWKNYKLDEFFTTKRKLYLLSIWYDVKLKTAESNTIKALASSNKQKRIKEFEKYVKILNEFKKSNI